MVLYFKTNNIYSHSSHTAERRIRITLCEGMSYTAHVAHRGGRGVGCYWIAQHSRQRADYNLDVEKSFLRYG